MRMQTFCCSAVVFISYIHQFTIYNTHTYTHRKTDRKCLSLLSVSIWSEYNMYKPEYLHFNILNYFHATNFMIYVVNHFFYVRTRAAAKATATAAPTKNNNNNKKNKKKERTKKIYNRNVSTPTSLWNIMHENRRKRMEMAGKEKQQIDYNVCELIHTRKK